MYISYGVDKENLFNNQELEEWLVISCILTTSNFYFKRDHVWRKSMLVSISLGLKGDRKKPSSLV